VTSRRSPGFDRLPRRAAADTRPDADGKRALFSTAEQPPMFGSVTVACSSCQERTVVSLGRAARLAVPSVHLPLLRPAPWSWVRCPACHRMSWVTVSVRL
jgi:hypothetical protein